MSYQSHKDGPVKGNSEQEDGWEEVLLCCRKMEKASEMGAEREEEPGHLGS